MFKESYLSKTDRNLQEITSIRDLGMETLKQKYLKPINLKGINSNNTNNLKKNND